MIILCCKILFNLSVKMDVSNFIPPSDNGVYILILTSILFQLCLYLIKKYRYFMTSISMYI